MKNKQQMLSEPIKRFLIQCVAKAGPEPERMLNELELCNRFSVSRRTAHKAVSDLIDMGYIQHLPGKRGVFSNPDYGAVVPYSVGIVGSCGNCSYMDAPSSTILGGFLCNALPLRFMTTFLTLNGTPAEADQELISSGLDAVLWFQPAAEYLPAIERAIRQHHLPVIIIGNSFNPVSPCPAVNTVTLDHASVGEQYYTYYAGTEYKNLLFCGRDASTYRALEKRWVGNGRTLSIFTENDDLALLPDLLKEKKIHSLICNGCNNLHHHILKLLRTLPDGKDCSILLSPGLHQEPLQKEYKTLNICSIHKDLNHDLFIRMGSRAAFHLKEMLGTGAQYCFENEYFQWDLK